MKKEFIYTSKFEREWQKLNLTDNDLIKLEDYLMLNPDKGVII